MSRNTSARQQLEQRVHWLPPEELCAQLDLRPGSKVAEIGAGSGDYSAAIARRVGPQCRVFAVEAASASSLPDAPPNLERVVGSPRKTNLPDDSCDVVVMADLLGQLADRQESLAEAKRILKPGGTLAITEWGPEAPAPPGSPLAQRIGFEETLRMLEMNAWSLTKKKEDWPSGYLLVFEPTDESVQS